MRVADSSVWIDYFNDRATLQTDLLDRWLGVEEVAIGDLIAVEVLQGCLSERKFNETQRLFDKLTMIDIAGRAVIIPAARNYRRLRSLGITVRKTIDTLIATRCILDDLPLLFSDRDFAPFVAHLGLRDAMVEPV